MTLRAVFFKTFLGILLKLVVMEMHVSTAFAQLEADVAYEVIAEVSAVKNNFVQAREKAVKMAFKSALEQGLREFLGDEEFGRNRPQMQKILSKSEKYVKSYRFLEAYDDPIESISQIKLEVVLFQDVVNKYLSQLGVATGLEGEKQVVILINESSLSSGSKPRFWETIPISETSLTRNFIEAGIPVVRRGFIRYAIPEGTVISAAKGDISAAVNIGMKATADIVIVGNATSTFIGRGQMQGQQSVRVVISVKVISSHHSALIAAKSDFAIASGTEDFVSEQEAFQRAGKKLTEFLIPTIQKYWEAGDGQKEVKQFLPTPEKYSPTLPWGDL